MVGRHFLDDRRRLTSWLSSINEIGINEFFQADLTQVFAELQACFCVIRITFFNRFIVLLGFLDSALDPPDLRGRQVFGPTDLILLLTVGVAVHMRHSHGHRLLCLGLIAKDVLVQHLLKRLDLLQLRAIHAKKAFICSIVVNLAHELIQCPLDHG